MLCNELTPKPAQKPEKTRKLKEEQATPGLNSACTGHNGALEEEGRGVGPSALSPPGGDTLLQVKHGKTNV